MAEKVAFIYQRDLEVAIMTALELVDHMAIDQQTTHIKAHLINALSQLQILQGRK